jgi:phage/plasmid-associated DNA primase
MDKNNNQMYKMWSIKNSYKSGTKHFIENNYEEYTLNDKIKRLETYDGSYNDRIHIDTYYKFFGDCDYYRKTFDDFANLLINFLKSSYNINLNKEDIMYTHNKNKIGSYHYVIPKYYASTEKLKEIHENFRKQYKNELIYNDNKKQRIVIDTSIYSEHWFRCPNQSKAGTQDSKHIIINGEMKDFIFDYIEKNSECIDNKIFLINNIKDTIQLNKKDDIINTNNCEQYDNIKNDNIKNENHIMIGEIQKLEWPIIYKFFDECYEPFRFNSYDYWINIGMGIKNRYGADGFKLWQYFSNKSSNPDSEYKLTEKYKSFGDNGYGKISIGTLYYYAKEDNKEKYTELIKKYSPFKNIDLSSVGIAKFIHMLKPNYFIYKNKILYCYNGTLWVRDDIPLLSYISNELYDFLLELCNDCFSDNKIITKLAKLKDLRFKREIVETCKEIPGLNNNKIEFDSKWYLFGFSNKVLDLQKMEIRDYKYDDYILTHTGYEWVEPSTEEYNTVTSLLKMIHPDPNEYQMWLEVYSTGLEGRCLEKFTMFTGNGRNGKGLSDDLALKAYGNYGVQINCSVLFEQQKTGACPELANIDKKRFGLFREPPSSGEIENSVVKNLTGGGDFTARGLYEAGTQKKNHLTIVLECNKKPKFRDEFMNAEEERLQIFEFGSTFELDSNKVDCSNRKYFANVEYKTDEWKINHRTAFIKIIIDAYREYKKRGYKFDIPKKVRERTMSYMAMSSNILTWIKENYEKTNNQTDYIKINDVFKLFTKSNYFYGMTKIDQRKYNRTYFVTEISESIFFKKYTKERIQINGKSLRNVIMNYKPKFDNNNSDSENDNENDN